MSKKQKKNLIRIIIAISLFICVLAVDKILTYGFNDQFKYGLASLIPNEDFGWLLPFTLYLGIYIYIGYDIIRKATINIAHGQVFDENFLMVVATFGAFGLGIYTGISQHNPEGFDEACAVLLFYQLGEWFQSYAVKKSRKSISSLMDIRPDYANLIKEDGSFEVVEPSIVKVNDNILIKPGEKIPLDGIIIKGSSTLDTKALTGESLPREVSEGSEVISGTVNLTGTLTVKVSKEFSNSTVSKILDLVENASSQKSKSENFITKFSKYYTPIVCGLALLLAIVPPLLYGFIDNNWLTWRDWIYRALSFLVVSCPCALVISVPLTFFAGIGGASSNGILVKGSSYLEKFNKANIFVFDKTGTLTKGNFAVKEISPLENKDEILKYAAIAESLSTHPIALSIKEAYKGDIDKDYVIENIAGKGIKAIGEKTILCGNDKLMDAFNIKYNKCNGVGSIVYVAVDNVYLGYILIVDEIKDDAKEMIYYLNEIHAKSVMLTGDNELIASSVANSLGLTTYKASLLPNDKVDEVDKLLNNKQKDDVLCFVGDGINDAPTLMKADIGIAMGGVGSDAAIEASDIVLMHDDLKSIKKAKQIAKKTMAIVYENIIFALAVKVIILILSALGIASMWIAVFGDVGVAVIAILNAMRASRKIKD